MTIPGIANTTCANQRGSLVIYLVIVLMLVSLAATTALQLAGNGIADSDMAERELKVFYLAESAVERQRGLFSAGASCAGLGPATPADIIYYNYEGGQVAVVEVDDTQSPSCFVTVEARIGDVVRRIKVDLLLGQGNGLYEPFPDQADFTANWTELANPPDNSGVYNWDGGQNCPIDVCPYTLEGSGSLHTGTINGGRYLARFRRGFSPAVDTGASGIDYLFSIAFRKTRTQGATSTSYMAVLFYDSTNDVETLVWENTLANTVPWTRDEITISLPPNQIYDEVRLLVDISGRTKKHKFQEVNTEVWFDQFRVPNLWGPGGAVIGGWEQL